MHPSSDPRKVKNPLLSAAGSDFPFENFGENAFLMPVTPTTPAILQEEPTVPTLPQTSGHQVPSGPIISQQSNTTLNLASSNLQQSPAPKEPVAQSQKTGYFTSILSSLPNLSLSSITGDSGYSQTAPPPSSHTLPPPPQFNVPPQSFSSNISYAPPNPYEFQGIQQGINLGSTNFPSSQLNQSLPQTGFPPSIAPPPVAPPPAVPPTGEATSYRLGNQRRLKYAPPPDIATNVIRQNYQSLATNFSPQQQIPNIPTKVFVPSTQPEVQSSVTQYGNFPIPSAPPLSNSQSRDNSSQNSFRTSPITVPDSGTQINPTEEVKQTISNNAAILTSLPQSIPSRILEPSTPQNTPADFAFSGFSAFKQQQKAETSSFPNIFGINEEHKIPIVTASSHNKTTLESVKEISHNQPDIEKTFTPISAAQVSEKLENLIAEHKEDTLSSASTDFSSEVAAITAKIPTDSLQEKTKPQDLSEELAEIDLTSGITEIIENEVLASGNLQSGDQTVLFQQNLENSFPLPSATNYFNDSTLSQNISNISDSQAVNTPNFFTPNFQGQIQDPFSFVQSTPIHPVKANEKSNNNPEIKTFQSSVSANLIKPELPTAGNFSKPSEVPEYPNYNIELNNTATSYNYENSPQSAAPTFFNPAQFSSPNYAFPVPSSSITSTNAAKSSVTSSVLNSVSGISPQGQFSFSQEVFNVMPEPTGSATLNPEQISINPMTTRSPQETVPPSLENLASGSAEKQMQYRPVYNHWFYRKEVETKVLWLPFSMHDSLNLEIAHNSNEISAETKVATDGGRFDVEILKREKAPVYWDGPKNEVRRCSWFYKGPTESRYTPYEETVCAKLEENYKQACTSNIWNRRVDLNNGEYIILHSPIVQLHYSPASTPELAASWGNNTGSEDNAYLQGISSRPKNVKRGMDEFSIDDGEPEKIDHVLFLVHGIGSACDIKFRSVEEVVDDFRSISYQLVQSHYRNTFEQGIVNRIEVLPISWHATLHSGIDKKLQATTLESIPKLRNFTNDTLIDVFLYTSPVYCETIMQRVGNELNRLYTLFNERNPEFTGSVYLGGHSLGSVILFDLLCHQTLDNSEPQYEDEPTQENNNDQDNEGTSKESSVKRKLSKKVNYVVGLAGTGQPFIKYPQLTFSPNAFFALGSPIGLFVTIRGIDALGEDFTLPTCPGFFNIFHPFDPAAYRIEPLISNEAVKYRPMLIPHHKGRKRMHLELKETMARVGADLKQRVLDSVKSTWNSLYQLAMFHTQDNQSLEKEIDKVVEEQFNKPLADSLQPAGDDGGADFKVGKLNSGRRFDYVLQEAPFECINEYIFALTSHVCYWESEDTMLLILKEIYGSMGIQTDAQLPQQTMSIERVSTPTISSPNNLMSPTSETGIDPTAPMSSKQVGPPPMSGFIKKS